MYNNSRITIADVAKLANVSTATVSRIINNKDTVSPQTRERVINAMKRLHFLENSSALDTESTTILMFVPNWGNPFGLKLMNGVVASAKAHNYQVFFYNVDCFDKRFSEYRHVFNACDFCGVLLLSPVANATFLEDLSMRCPVVMCSEYVDTPCISFVSVDDRAAAQKAVEYLLSIGRRRIALFNGSMEKKYARFREQGYRDALAAYDVSVNESLLVHISTIDYALATSYAISLLSQADRPDAVFAISDVFAAAVINTATKLGLRVPEDLAVVGFDDIDLATQTSPSITTVRQPSFQIGYQACDMLIEMLHAPDAVAGRKIMLDTELIIRESTISSPGGK